MVVLNHTNSAGINGFYEEAIVVDGDMPNDFNCLLEEVAGFRSQPHMARAASSGDSPYGNLDRFGSRKASEAIACEIDRYWHTERKRFLLPFNSIAYIEDLGEIGD